MRQVGTDLFSLSVPESMTLWFESENDLVTDTIFISTSVGLLGSIEFINGTGEPDLQTRCEDAVIAEIDALAGYVDTIEDEYPTEMVTVFNDESGTHSRRHFFKYLDQVAVHLTLTENFTDSDHVIAREILDSVTVNLNDIKAPTLERINFKFDPNTRLDKFGVNRFILVQD